MVRPEVVATVLLAVAVAVALGRLWWWQRQAMPRASWGRIAALGALGVLSGGLLYLTLFPPRLPVGGETLVVATAGAPRALTPARGERLLALPEAPPIAKAERVPDLATALRRYPQGQRLRIVGAGLTARDRDTAITLPITFRPPPVPRGLIRLEPPARTAAGAVFTVAGQANGLAGGVVELLDPAGRPVDMRKLGGDGRFTLAGTARAPGTALFTLRLRDAGQSVVSDTPVPLWTVPERPVRVLLLGAPGPETKYLRRWASDAGIALTSPLEAGGGVRLGDAPVGLDPATLRRFDAVIIDDRSWSALGGGARGAITGAVGNGLGLILRMSGAATPAARREWNALGLTVAGGSELAPVALPPPASDAETLVARRGPGTPDAAAELNTLDDPVPELGRWNVRVGPELVPLLTDEAGALLAGWRARGQGRVVLWAVADSYALLLGGQRDRYYDWWSRAVTTVARATPEFTPELPAVAQAGERVAICGVEGRPRVIAPDGAVTTLEIDGPPGTAGCAAFWPGASGFHTIVQPGRGGERQAVMYVYLATALQAAGELSIAEDTVRLAGRPSPSAASVLLAGGRGPAWPWFLGWLAVSAALWWLERRRRVRRSAASPQ